MVCRERGTGKYDKFYEEGVYNCAGCDTPLYMSRTKFNSGCGWPAFFEGLPGAINRSVSIGHLFVHSSRNVNVNFRFCFEEISVTIGEPYFFSLTLMGEEPR